MSENHNHNHNLNCFGYLSDIGFYNVDLQINNIIKKFETSYNIVYTYTDRYNSYSPDWASIKISWGDENLYKKQERFIINVA